LGNAYANFIEVVKVHMTDHDRKEDQIHPTEYIKKIRRREKDDTLEEEETLKEVGSTCDPDSETRYLLRGK
jgi:predicted GIY-YIG superfamily endonuclease